MNQESKGRWIDRRQSKVMINFRHCMHGLLGLKRPIKRSLQANGSRQCSFEQWSPRPTTDASHMGLYRHYPHVQKAAVHVPRNEAVERRNFQRTAHPQLRRSVVTQMFILVQDAGSGSSSARDEKSRGAVESNSQARKSASTTAAIPTRNRHYSGRSIQHWNPQYDSFACRCSIRTLQVLSFSMTKLSSLLSTATATTSLLQGTSRAHPRAYSSKTRHNSCPKSPRRRCWSRLYLANS